MVAGYSRAEFDNLQLVDLTFVKLAIPKEGVYNGFGHPVNPSKVVDDFDNALQTVYNAAKNGTPLPSEFFVPDLWHIALGRAKMIPKENGQELWEAACVGVRLGRTFYTHESPESKGNHPGNLFSKPLAEPRWNN